ncbi:MAG: penicillin-binding protein, partial [bacterium]|nr:penicillin-binding protein [bacterium]
PPRPERLIPRRMAYDMTEMLHSVVESGTGKGASFGTPAAGKTGTSQDYRDAWFIGFTADATAGVWVGNDDDSPMNRVTGGSVPARIWRETMAAYASSRSARPLVADDRVPPYGRPESDDVLADFVHSIKRFFGD